MAGKDEIGRRRQYGKAELFELGGQGSPSGNDSLIALLEMGLVLNGGDGTHNGQAVKRVGVEAVLDPFQRFDQVGVADGVTDAQTGQRAGFAQGVNDQQVVVVLGQRNGRFATKIDVGLIDYDHTIRIGADDLLNGGEGQQSARRRVWIGENDATDFFATDFRVFCRLTAVIGGIDRKVVSQWYGALGDAVEAAIDRVKAVSDVRKQNGRIVFQQRLEDMGQHFIRTIADKYLAGADLVALGNGVFQQVSVWIGIQAQA